LSFGCLALVLPLACAAADLRPAGVSNFSQVDEHTFRGGQPSQTGLEQLARLGIKTVLDLRLPGPRTETEKRTVESLGMRYVNIGLPALSAPTPEQVSQALNLLDSGSSVGWPVFIHCLRGKDRTGTIVACYRISRHGWDNQRALQEARQHGLSRFEPAMQHFILRYQAPGGQPAGAQPARAQPAVSSPASR
jgi:tyrosine-protein phosphatase SIW14